MSAFQAVRGMNDILPESCRIWQIVEDILQKSACRYGYQQIRLPLVESAQVFQRSIGEVTDIVEKEMYVFPDRNGDLLALRPEGTASCVRACLQQGLLHNQSQKLWYLGPMFRHERPQQGRYRQFHQFGIEALGFSGPDVDLELILLSARIFSELKITPLPRLELNTLGSEDARLSYRDALVAFLSRYEDKLDDDSKRRLTRNPLRILDSKNEGVLALLENAPRLWDFLDEKSRQHFEDITAALSHLGIPFVHNHRLVRGLDYYNRTVFEWVAEHGLGAQATLCAGGRYDGLVERLGGSATPAAGFALGLERLIALVDAPVDKTVADVCILLADDAAMPYALKVGEILRSHSTNLRVQQFCGKATLKTQLRHADRWGVVAALIVGSQEQSDGTVTIKWMRDRDRKQLTCSIAQSMEYITNL